MTISEISFAREQKSCVIALHCSLGSGRQWTKLTGALGAGYQLVAPDIAGYGDYGHDFDLPLTLADEVEFLIDRIDAGTGPVHLVGHSYGGTIAFKMATASPLASRVRSLTLIEPVLPTLLKENAADRRLHDLFAQLARNVSVELSRGLSIEAIDRFMSYWNGSGSAEPLSPDVKLRMVECIDKLPHDFAAALSEENVTAAAAGIKVPTLLFSGGLSPYMTQRIVGRLASIIVDAQTHHLPAAGHMLPLTHARQINPQISAHIARADDLARVTLASGLGSHGWAANREIGPAPK
jgi:pimeloyl-ACP methyl ester carboxylesterase